MTASPGTRLVKSYLCGNIQVVFAKWHLQYVLMSVNAVEQREMALSPLSFSSFSLSLSSRSLSLSSPLSHTRLECTAYLSGSGF